MSTARTKPAKLEDVLNILSSGFIKGSLGGFLKTSSAGEMIRGSNPVNREIRVGITHVSDIRSFFFHFCDFILLMLLFWSLFPFLFGTTELIERMGIKMIWNKILFFENYVWNHFELNVMVWYKFEKNKNNSDYYIKNKKISTRFMRKTNYS